MENKRKIASIIRRLSTDSEGEVIACINALRKLCNFNDLGNLIEGSNGEDKLSKKEMQYLYDAGYKDGFQKGSEEGYKSGLEEGRKSAYHRNSFGDVFDNSSEESRVLYCDKHKNKLMEKEKLFVDSCVERTTILFKTLTPAQLKWLNDIYVRLGGK